MKRVLPAAVLLTVFFTVNAQAQATYNSSSYPEISTGNAAYTSGNTSASMYQNQGTASSYDPYQNQGTAGAASYNSYQNQGTTGMPSSYVPSQNSSAYPSTDIVTNNGTGVQVNDPYTGNNAFGASNTPTGMSDPYSASSLSNSNTGSSLYGNTSSMTDPGVSSTAVPYSVATPSPSESNGNSTVIQPGATPSPLPISSLSDTDGATTVSDGSNNVADNDMMGLLDTQNEDAGEPLYSSTKQYVEKLRSSGFSCTYRGKQGPTSESVFASFSGNNVTLNTIAVFSDTETDCILYVLRFVDFNGKNTDLVSPLLDALNADYRFAKFYSAPNGTVSVTLDLLFTPENAGEICYDGLRRLLNICDECYEALSSSIEALPDEGQGIAMWDDSDVDDTNSDSSQVAVTPTSSNLVTPPVEQIQETYGGRNIIMKIKIRNGGSVNVRMGPDQNTILVGTAEGGRIYDCLSVADNGWYEIVLPNGMTGFISGKRVTELK